VNAAQSTHPLRFEQFADAQSAKAALEAAFPRGSPAAPALQALVDMGAHGKAIDQDTVAFRLFENRTPFAAWCWYVAVKADKNKMISRTVVSLAGVGM
jgi:hypothetical protein